MKVQLSTEEMAFVLSSATSASSVDRPCGPSETLVCRCIFRITRTRKQRFATVLISFLEVLEGVDVGKRPFTHGGVPEQHAELK